jgi:hypothetical protein
MAVRRLVRVAAVVALDARAGFSGAVRPVLVVGGLVMFTVGAWSVIPAAGWFVGGLCAIFLEFLLTPDGVNQGADPGTKN